MIIFTVLSFDPLHYLDTSFWVVLVLISLFTVIVRNMRERAGQSWPVVNGTVESAELAVTDGRVRAEVRYSYSVDGEYYSGLFFRIPNSTKKGEKILAQFPKGLHVLVHHKPGAPDVSVLDREEIKNRAQFPVEIC